MKQWVSELGLVAVFLASASVGCSTEDATTDAADDGRDEESTADDDKPADGADAGDAGDAGADTDEPLYAVMFEVYDDVGSNSYLSLIDTLDIDELDVAASREFAGGRAFLQSYNGWIFVGDPTTPVVTRYSVSKDGQLVEDGDIGFANYGLDAGSLDDWNINFISEDKAYLFDFREGRTIIWNPTTLEITGEITAPDELFREGWSLEGSPGVVRDGLLYRTFDFANYDTAEQSDEIWLGVYDVEKDELVELVEEERCGALGNLVHVDEEGTIYFSSWIWNVADTKLYDGPSACVLRINEGESTFDQDWQLDYSAFTEGREGAMFSYMGDGHVLFSAFHDENLTIDEETDPWAYAGSQNWSVWSYELGADEATRVKGLDLNAGAFTPLNLEGRAFIMVPNSTWSSTQLYEIEGNEATPSLNVPGWSYQFKKVR